MKTFLTYVWILLFIFSCNKFEYSEAKVQPCSLCDYAKQLEGEYRGFNQSVLPYYNDSVTAYVDQIFLGNSHYEDSTVMHFQLTLVFDNSAGFPPPNTYIDTIRIINTTGATMDFELYGSSGFRECIEYIDPTQLKLNRRHSYFNTSVQWYLGTLYRQ